MRRLREAQGLTMRWLAVEIGVTTTFLFQIEHGHVYPSPERRKRLAQALRAPALEAPLSNAS